MRKIAMGLAGVAVLGMAACHPPHPKRPVDTPLKALSALDCPAEQGELALKSAASDGQSCQYTTEDGGQVSVQLIKFTGDPQTALTPIEAKLRAEIPPDTEAGAKADGADAGGKDQVDINLPGIHIRAHDHGGSHDAADVQIGAGGNSVVINAHDNSAQVQIDARGSGIRRMFILTTDHPGPNGCKTVGYQASGPTGGPIAVATFMTKDDDGLRDEIRSLLKHNVGG